MRARGGLAAENALLNLVAREVTGLNRQGRQALLINLGAGSAAVLESRLAAAVGDGFCVDRVDERLFRVEHPRVGRQWQESIVHMPGVPDRHYDIAFANWVLEHVDDVGSTIREVTRILRPGGLMVATLPNPRAPEFRLAAHTPKWVHKAFLPDSFETHYAYGSISRVREFLEGSGMSIERSLCAPVVGTYLSRLPWWVSWLGRAYDEVVVGLAVVPLCGAVVVAARRRTPND
jgi:SAM-dependent methyltransferase